MTKTTKKNRKKYHSRKKSQEKSVFSPIGKQVQMVCNYGPYKQGSVHTVKEEGIDWFRFEGKKNLLVSKDFVTFNVRNFEN